MSDGQVESHSLFKCDVCLSEYGASIKQKFLLCLHSFCQSCLAEIKQNDVIRCPICREFHVHSSDVSSLPNNYFEALKEIERKMKDEMERRIFNLELKKNLQIAVLEEQVTNMEIKVLKKKMTMDNVSLFLLNRMGVISKHKEKLLEIRKGRRTNSRPVN